MRAALAAGANPTVTQRTALFSFGTGSNINYDLSPNGTIVALRPASADAELMVVLNWFSELQ